MCDWWKPTTFAPSPADWPLFLPDWSLCANNSLCPTIVQRLSVQSPIARSETYSIESPSDVLVGIYILFSWPVWIQGLISPGSFWKTIKSSVLHPSTVGGYQRLLLTPEANCNPPHCSVGVTQHRIVTYSNGDIPSCFPLTWAKGILPDSRSIVKEERKKTYGIRPKWKTGIRPKVKLFSGIKPKTFGLIPTFSRKT